MEQVSVGTMQLDRLDADARRTTGRSDEFLLDLLEAGNIERSRWRLGRQLRNRRGCHRRPSALGKRNELAAFPGHLRRNFPARMRQLNGHRYRRRVRARYRQTLGQGLLARVVVKSEAAIGNAADRGYRGGLDREHARARLQKLAPMHDVPVSGAAIYRRVLAHRRYDDAIVELEFAECEG